MLRPQFVLTPGVYAVGGGGGGGGGSAGTPIGLLLLLTYAS